MKNNGADKGSSSESQSDDEVDELPKASKAKLSMSRNSVSAEVFGEWNKKENFQPRVIEKSSEQQQRKSFIFASLDNTEKAIVVNTMEEKSFTVGKLLIQQGTTERALCRRFRETGVQQDLSQEEGPKFLKFYHPGEAFGELALLYNAPRAATIKATTDCKCWVLDRETFHHIVKDAAARKREEYEKFLGNIEILKSIDVYEKMQIADALKSVSFAAGVYVIKQGDWGDVFYMIESEQQWPKRCLLLAGKRLT